VLELLEEQHDERLKDDELVDDEKEHDVFDDDVDVLLEVVWDDDEDIK